MENKINEIKVLEKLKRRHGIVDALQDELLEDIIEDTMAHYLAIAGEVAGVAVEAIPVDHSFIIVDVASKRYIRRGSEGLTIERVDQYQAQYEEPSKDFAEYMSIIIGVFKKPDVDNGKGRVILY